MTKPRIHGSDIPFIKWFRGRSELNSSPAIAGGMARSDVDCMLSLDDIVHRYYTADHRRTQFLMHLEVKMRQPISESNFDSANFYRRHESQIDTFAKVHASTKRETVFIKKRNGTSIKTTLINYGVCWLIMDGVCPDTSNHFMWGRYKVKDGVFDMFSDAIQWITLSGVAELISRLRFEIDPDFGLTGE